MDVFNQTILRNNAFMMCPLLLGIMAGCGNVGERAAPKEVVSTAPSTRTATVDEMFHAAFLQYRNAMKFGFALNEVTHGMLKIDNDFRAAEYKHGFYLPIEAEPLVELAHGEDVFRKNTYSSDPDTATFATTCLAIIKSPHRLRFSNYVLGAGENDSEFKGEFVIYLYD